MASVPTPQTPVLTVGCRMLRSPSHESVTTDLSLFSVSSISSERRGVHFAARGPSPNPESRPQSGQLDASCPLCYVYDREDVYHFIAICPRLAGVRFKWSNQQYLEGYQFMNYVNGDDWYRLIGYCKEAWMLRQSLLPADIPEVLWFEEENEVIKSCAALSSVLGLQKSFSTSDISQLPSPTGNQEHHLRPAVSEIALSSSQRYAYMLGGGRLEASSRSCSTWVAVGDVTSASQLPSPHGHSSQHPPGLSPADLVRSVNKKVRQNYIRRRLLTTYKALERLSQSEFNLDRLEAVAAAAAPANRLAVPAPSSVIRTVGKNRGLNVALTVSDVERERGKPLSKYDRNMMIFNWLHTLDDAEAEPP